MVVVLLLCSSKLTALRESAVFAHFSLTLLLCCCYCRGAVQFDCVDGINKKIALSFPCYVMLLLLLVVVLLL